MEKNSIFFQNMVVKKTVISRLDMTV